jgi:hypothetical protein
MKTLFALISTIALASAANAQQIIGNYTPVNGDPNGMIEFNLTQNSVTLALYSANSYSPSSGYSAINSSGDFFAQHLNYYYVGLRRYDPILNDYIAHSTFHLGDFENFFSRGLAFDDNDQLYVLKCRENYRAYYENSAYLYKVDSQLGGQDNNPTLVGTLSTTLDADSEFSALDYHDGKLYSYLAPGGIVEINPNTADFNYLNPTLKHVSPLDASHLVVSGLCISDSGVFYALLIRILPNGWTDFPFLAIIDPETGAFSPINEHRIPFVANIGIEFIEGPTPPFALWQSGTTGNTPLGRFKVKGSGANANEQVAVYFTTDLTAPPATIPAGLPGAGTQLNIGGTLHYLGTATADQNGAFKVPTGGVPASFRDKLLFQGVNLSNSKTTNFFRVIM